MKYCSVSSSDSFALALLRSKSTSLPSSICACSLLSICSNFTMAVVSDRKRIDSMKKGTIMPSTLISRYGDSVVSKMSSVKWKFTSPFSPCVLLI